MSLNPMLWRVLWPSSHNTRHSIPLQDTVNLPCMVITHFLDGRGAYLRAWARGYTCTKGIYAEREGPWSYHQRGGG